MTSLDVIHSFWAYQLGVKADANPGVNNVAYTKPSTARAVHGALRRAVRPVARRDVQLRPGRDAGRVPGLGGATKAQFMADVTRNAAAVRPHLRPDRDPAARQGPVIKKLGLTAAGGGYYPPQDPVQP